MKNTLLDIPIENLTRQDILEHILKYLIKPRNFFHIVSLNPEILIEAKKNTKFKNVVIAAQIRVIDGSGIAGAATLKGIPYGQRYTGVELMGDLLKIADEQRLRVMLLGGLPKVAEKIVNCQKQAGSEAIFTATYGIKDKQKSASGEIKKIISIVTDFRPHILLVAFGSPFSELWLYDHRNYLEGVLGASVGGAFDYFAGTVSKPPLLIRRLGLEYAIRLLHQPWRWRRQLSLLTFIRMSLVEAIRYRLKI